MWLRYLIQKLRKNGYLLLHKNIIGRMYLIFCENYALTDNSLSIQRMRAAITPKSPREIKLRRFYRTFSVSQTGCLWRRAWLPVLKIFSDDINLNVWAYGSVCII